MVPGDSDVLRFRKRPPLGANLRMRQSEREWGLVAILDALGAAGYSDDEIERFLRSREIVLGLLAEKAEVVLGEIQLNKMTTFTFGDTVVIVYRTKRSTSHKDIEAFFTLLRKFMVDSLCHRILFRGAVAIGSFYANDDTNTVLGSAVADAAAWYTSAEWVGIHATPHASLLIDSLTGGGADLDRLIVDYDVPMRDSTKKRLKAVNWPRAFYVASLTPCGEEDDERAKCLELLTRHRIPKGIEDKYFNTVAFFDFAGKRRAKTSKKRTS